MWQSLLCHSLLAVAVATFTSFRFNHECITSSVLCFQARTTIRFPLQNFQVPFPKVPPLPSPPSHSVEISDSIRCLEHGAHPSIPFCNLLMSANVPLRFRLFCMHCHLPSSHIRDHQPYMMRSILCWGSGETMHRNRPALLILRRQD